MRSFYVVLIAISGLYLFAQLMAWIFFNKVFFPDAGELFAEKKDKNLWQTVFPKDMLRLVVVLFVGAFVGLLLDYAGVVGWLTLPIGAIAGIVVNFLVNTLFSPIYFKLHKSGEPTEAELDGMTGRVVEDIDPDYYGVIEVWHGRKSYLIRVVSANNRYIRKGERVVVLYSENGCCFVESEEHLCDVLFEDGVDYEKLFSDDENNDSVEQKSTE
ncbi:MAG: hypothetical protein ACI4JS_09690 [Oscillospiraceae bacterium]